MGAEVSVLESEIAAYEAGAGRPFGMTRSYSQRDRTTRRTAPANSTMAETGDNMTTAEGLHSTAATDPRIAQYPIWVAKAHLLALNIPAGVLSP